MKVIEIVSTRKTSRFGVVCFDFDAQTSDMKWTACRIELHKTEILIRTRKDMHNLLRTYAIYDNAVGSSSDVELWQLGDLIPPFFNITCEV